MELHPFLLLFELRRAVDVLERTLMTRLDAADWPRLTVTQVLLFVHLQPEGVTAAELARRMGMSRQSMQKNLDRLRELNLVTLQPHPRDRRSSLVTRTPDGARFAQAAAQVVSAYLQQFELGRRSLLDVLDVVSELFQANVGVVNTDTQMMRASYRVLATAGTLLSTLNVTTDTAAAWSGRPASGRQRAARPLPSMTR